MSYKNPTIPSLTLKGLDKKIQEIQVLLTSLSWINKSFGLVDRIVGEKDGQPYIYPATFETNTIDPVNVLPSDTWGTYTFWTAGDSDFDLNIDFPPKNPIITVPVSCIFYMDIRKIDSTTNYKETKSKVKDDIFNFFNKVQVNRLIPTAFIEDDITRVFAGFSIEQVDNKFRMYPKWACRMDFDFSYRDDCYVLNTY